MIRPRTPSRRARRDFRKLILTGTIAAASLLLAPAARAAMIVWDAGSSADFNWDTAANWGPDGVPGTADDVIFPGIIPNPGTLLNPSTIALGTGDLANSLRFSNSYSLIGGDLTLTSGTITADLGTYSTIAAQLKGSAGLTLSGSANSGRGALRLTNASNSYTGTTTVNSGTLIVENNGSLGGDTLSTVVVNGTQTPGGVGGSLLLAGGYTTGFTLTHGVSISGASGGSIAVGNTPPLSGGALISVGNNTITGQFTSTQPGPGLYTGLTSTFGLLTLGDVAIGGTAGTNFTTFGTTGSIGSYAITGVLSGTGSIQKTGNSTLIVAPTDATGFAGTVRITTGSVRIGAGAALGANAGTNTASLLDLNGGTLEVRSDTPAIGKAIYLRTGSTLFADRAAGSSVINQTASFGVLRFEESLTLTFNGRNGYGMSFGTNNALATSNSTSGSTFTNNLNGPLTFTGTFWDITNGTGRTLIFNGTGDTTITSNVLGSGGNHILTKAGTGTLTINGTGSTYTGATNIQAGTLSINDFRGITLASTSAVNIGSGTTGATLNIKGSAPTAANLTFGASRPLVLLGTSGGATINANQGGTNPVLFNNTAAITSGAGSKTLTLGGTNTANNEIRGIIQDNLTGTNNTSLTKTESGTWLLSGANTYTGATTISGGTLKLQANAATTATILADASAITFNSNATTLAAGGSLEFVGFSASATTETLGALTPTLGAGTVKLTAATVSPAATNLVFSSLGTVANGTGINFNTTGGSGGTVTINGVATSTATTLSGNGHFYINGADFARSSGGVMVAPVYGTDAGFENAAAGAATLTGGNHNLVTGNITAQTLLSISSLKLTTNTLALTGLLTINVGANTSGGILVSGGTTAAISGTGVTTGGSGDMVIRVDGGGDILTLSAPVTSTTTGGVTKNGAGMLVLSATNAQTGGFTINEGTVQLSGTGKIGANAGSATTATLNIRQGASLDLNGVTMAGTPIAQFNGAGTIKNTSATAAMFTVGSSNGTGTFSGTIDQTAGVISIIKAGTGGQTWSGTSTYTGSTTIGSTGIVSVNTLANIGTASGIGKGNNTDDTTNAASLVFTGTTGGLAYTGTTSVSIDRLFTMSGGGQIANNSGNSSALIFNKTSPVIFGTTAAQTLTLGGSSLGDNQINLKLLDPSAGALSINKTGAGLWILGNSANTYTGTTTITNGYLNAQDGTSLPNSSGLILGATTTAGVLETSGNFTRNVVASGSAGTNTVSWNASLTTAGAGFSAAGSKLVVALGGLATPTALQWGANGFAVSTTATAPLIFNSTTALSEVEFRNAIDLNAATRTILVDDNTSTFTDFATITGVISNGTGTAGISKSGAGLLQLLGANTYNGTTAVTAGTLVVTSLGNSTTGGATSVGTATGANLLTQAVTLGNAGTTAGILVYAGPGETSDRYIQINTTTGNTQIIADGSGPLVLTNVNNTGAAGNKTLFLRGTNTLANEITSVLADNVVGTNTLGITHDTIGTWILSGNNTYTGTTTITAGTLGVGSNAAFGGFGGTAGTLSINNSTIFASGGDRSIANPVTHGATTNNVAAFIGDYSLNLTGNWTDGTTTSSARFVRNNITTGKTLTFSGNYTWTTVQAAGANAFVTFDGSGDTIINGLISQNSGFTGSTTSATNAVMGLTYAGTGSLTLGNSGNAYLGATTISNGTLKLGANEVIPDGVVTGASTTTAASTASTTVTAPTTGLYAGMSFTGTGVAPNSIIANINSAGDFVSNNAQTISSGTALSFSITRNGVVMSPAAAVTATLDLNGRTETINGFTATSAGNSVITNSAVGAASLTFGSSNTAVTINSTGGGATTITNSGGSLSLTKTGTATATITTGQALTYTGSTNVTGGTFTIASPLNGTTALSATGTGSILNLTGGLSAPGAITSVTVGGGAFLSLLDGVGTPLPSLTSLNLGAGSGTATLSLELGTTSDTLTTSAVTLANTLTFNLSGVAGLADGTPYDLLVAPASSFGGLVGTDYLLGSQPGGFSAGTLSIAPDGSKLVYTTGTAFVVDLYWNNTTGDNSWAHNVGGVTNFTTNLAGTIDGTFTPGPGSTVIFGSTNATTLTGTTFTTSLDSSFTVKGLQFTANPAGVTAWTIDTGTPATSTLTIKASGIDVAANAGAVTLNPNLILGAAQIWNVDGTGTSSLTATGIISGDGFLLTKTGAGTLTLAGVNTFDGGLTVKGGTVIATTSNKALGGAVGTGTVTLGDTAGGGAASLLIGTTGLTYANPIVLATGATGPLTIGNSADIAAMTFSGGVTGTNNFTIANNSATAAARTIAFSTAAVNNAGTVTNTGTSTGTTTISGGIGSNVTQIIENSTTSALTISTNALNVNAAGTTLQNVAGTKVLTVSAGIQGTGDLILKNDSVTAGGVTLSGSINHTGTITNNGTGVNSVNGNIISGVIGTNVTGVIQDSANSALQLTGANLFTSGITIKSGILEGATSAASLGAAGNVITLGDTSGSNSASLRLQSNIVPYNATPVNVVAGSSGTLSIMGSRTTGVNTFPGAITLAHDLVIAAGDAGATTAALTLSGGITGTGNLAITYSATALTGGVTFSTNPINIAGTITNNGNTTATTTISGGVGANVTSITQNSTTSALTISTTPLTVNSSGTTLINTAGTKVLTVSGGVTGTGNLVLQNNSATAAGVTLTTNSVNNTGTITNSGTGSGSATITGGVGANVTAITEASTTSAFTISTNPLTVNSAGTTVTVNSGAQVLTLSGGVTGTGDLVLNNNSNTAARLTLTTSAVNNTGKVTNSGTNSGAGTVTITGGIGANVTDVIQASTTSALTVTGTTAVGASGKTIQNTLGGKALTINGGVTGTGDLVIKNESTLAAGVTFGTASINHVGKVTNSGTGTGTATITAVIGANVTEVIQASSTSPLTLSGANLFLGNVTLSAGTLNINNAAALGSGAGTFVIGGGTTFDNTTAAAITLTGNNPLTLDGSFTFTGTKDLNLGTGAATLGSAAGSSRTITTTAGTLTIGGSIADGTTANSIVKTGAGTLALTGANAFTGSSTVNGGALAIVADAGLGAAPGTTTPGHLTLNGGALVATGTFTLDSNRGVVLNGIGGQINVTSGTLTYGGIATGTGGLEKAGTGTTVLSGVNTYSGATLISGGVLSIAADSGLGTAPGAATPAQLILNGGTLGSTADFALDANRGISLGAAGGSIDVLTATTLTYGGIIADTGALTKTGAGTLVLSSANTFTGAVNVSGGVLTVTNNSSLGTTAGGVSIVAGGTVALQNNVSVGAEALTLTAGATDAILRNFSDNNTWSGNITVNTGSSTGRTRILSDAGNLLITGNITTSGSNDFVIGGVSNGEISGIISGPRPVFKSSSGGGTWILSNPANDYTGRTNISNGAIQISTEGNLGAVPGTFTANQLIFGGAATNGMLITTATMSISANRGVTLSAGGGTFSTNFGTTLTVNSVIAGASAPLTKIGDGALTLAAANTYSGATTINAGTLALSDAGALADATAVDVAASAAAFDISAISASGETIGSLAGAVGSAVVLGGKNLTAGGNNSSTTFAGAISGIGGSFTKDGSGTLVLSGTNTYTGDTVILNGTGNVLSVSADENLGAGTGITINQNARLQATASFATSKNVTLVGASANLEVMTGAVLTHNGTVSGSSLSPRKSGAGTLVLNGPNSFATGSVFLVADGGLSLGNAAALNGATLKYNGGLTLDNSTGASLAPTGLAGFQMTSGFTFTGTHSLDLSGAETGFVQTAGTARTITVVANTLTLGGITTAGTFTASGTAKVDGGLTKEGAGTLTLASASDYTGATTVNGGTLNLLGSLGATSVTINNAGSILASAPGGTTMIGGVVTINNGGLLMPGGNGIGTLDLGGITLNDGAAITFDLASLASYDHVISSLGILTLGSGTETINIAGTVAAGIYTLMTYASKTGGTFTLGTTPGGYNYSLVTDATQTQLIVTTGPRSLFWDAVPATTSVANDGAGTWSDGGATFYDPGTNGNATWDNASNDSVTFGAAPAGSGGIVTLGTNVRVGGTLTFAPVATPYTIGTIGSTNTLTLIGGIVANNSVTINAPTILGASQAWSVAAGQTLTVTGAVSEIGGVHALTKSGDGTLVLSGTSTYTGGTTISGGVLRTGAADVLPTTGLVSLADAAGVLLDLDGNNQTIASLAGGGSSGGNVGLGSATLTVGDASNTTFAGAISGTGGSLVKQGSGTLTLSGANSYTGSTAINDGTLKLGAANALPSTTTVTLADVAGTALDLSGNNHTIASLAGGGSNGGNVALGSATLTVGDASNTTFAGGISGTGGSLVKQGSGTLTLSGANSYTGSTAINDGTLKLGAANALPSTTTVTLADVAGTALDLSGNNQTIASLAGGGSNGGNVGLGSATLTVGDTSNTTFAGGISGTGGSLVKHGSGTLTLSGANTFSGPVTVSGGSLGVSGSSNLGNGTLLTLAGGTLRATGSFDLGGGRNLSLGSGGGTLDIPSGSDLLTVSGTITGSTALMKTGAGTLVVNNDNSAAFSGPTTISAGTFRVMNSSGSATGSGEVSVDLGGTLAGTGAAGGHVTVSSGGTLAVGLGSDIATLKTGALTLTNGATFTLELSTAILGADLVQVVDAIPADGDLTISGPVTLALTDLNPGALSLHDHIVFATYTGDRLGSGFFRVPGFGYDLTDYTGDDLNAAYFQFNGTPMAIDYDYTDGTNYPGVTAVALVVVPEPSTALALATSSMLLLGLRRRRR